MKVKLFWKNAPLSGDNAHELEDEINAWLTENPRVKVAQVKQSASGGSLGVSLWLMSVWYEDGAP
jgi:hypothetical protein